MNVARSAKGVILLAIALFAFGGCRRAEVDDGTKPKPLTLPELVLREDSSDELLLTWVDKNGDGHTVTKIEDVPIEGRDQVRVVVVGKDEGTRELFYVANLTVKNADGSYPVTTMPRSEWDGMIAKRRARLLEPAAPAPTPVPTPSPSPAPTPSQVEPPRGSTVVVYTASWCGACRSTVAYLKQRRIPFIEKDIEEDEVAAMEMQRKLARAGMRGGSIPVIDIRGKIVVGFDKRAIDQALMSTSGGVAL